MIVDFNRRGKKIRTKENGNTEGRRNRKKNNERIWKRGGKENMETEKGENK